MAKANSGHSVPKSAMAMAIVAIPVAPPLYNTGFLITWLFLVFIFYHAVLRCVLSAEFFTLKTGLDWIGDGVKFNITPTRRWKKRVFSSRCTESVDSDSHGQTCGAIAFRTVQGAAASAATEKVRVSRVVWVRGISLDRSIASAGLRRSCRRVTFYARSDTSTFHKSADPVTGGPDRVTWP